MYHRAIPFKHAHACFKQAAVLGARNRAYPFDVGSAGHQDAHVHTIFGGIDQALRIHARGHEISIGNPQGFAGHAHSEQIQTHHVGIVGRGGHQTRIGEAFGFAAVGIVHIAEFFSIVIDLGGGIAWSGL